MEFALVRPPFERVPLPLAFALAAAKLLGWAGFAFVNFVAATVAREFCARLSVGGFVAGICFGTAFGRSPLK
ncbi:MAG TPA: hypothetical protein VJS43_02715 [Candidatus Acidoferrales bacterium]|nr:hypothetical protein [Candidatus Acidoferrales bacterium]